MTRLMDIIAQLISVVCYPLFIPTYGMALFCYAYSMHVQPLSIVWILIAVIGTLLLTCALPISAIAILMRQDKVKDIQIEDAKERRVPYIYTIIGFGCWSYFIIHILQAPHSLRFISIGAVVAITLVALINHKWKISAHLTGFGGLFGGLISYCLEIGAIPTWSMLCVWFLGALVIMFARLRLNAHTGAQVSAGWLLGMACTCLPYCIYLLYAA